MTPSKDGAGLPRLVKPLGGLQAEVLADLGSYQVDLSGARAALLEMRNHRNPELLTMLWECAVVRYGRIFATGVRHQFDRHAYVEGLSKENRATHEAIVATRNKHVAHSVNTDEVVVPVFTLTDTSQGLEPRILGAGTIVGRLIPVRATAASDFLRLLDEAEEAFRNAHDELAGVLEEELARFDLSELYKIPNLRVRSTPRGTRKKTRRRR